MSYKQQRTELRTIVAPYRPRQLLDMTPYRHDPVLYAYKHLKVAYLTPDQEALLRAAAQPRARVLAPSANETGKSFISAILCSWHYDCFYPSLTITTAPAQAQVEDILFRELRRLRRNDPDFSPKAPRLQADLDRLCVGYTASTADSFQGRHDADVMVVFDEAEGIKEEFWTAAEAFADRWVCLYNPTTSKSQAAREERRKDSWAIVRMSAFTHPNIAAELAGMPRPVPNAVSLHKLKDRLKKWGKLLTLEEPRKSNDVELDGQWWRLGPVAEARLCGKRPSRAVNTVFAQGTWDHVHTVKHPDGENNRLLPRIGCDPARFGDDFTTIHVRRGKCSIHHEAHNGWDTSDTALRIRQLASQFAPSRSNEVPVLVDVVGVGGGVVDQLKGMNVYSVASQHKSTFPDDYPDLRSQMHFDFEQQCTAGCVDLSRIDTHDIEEQLNAVCYELTTRGQRAVWPKKIVKKELGRSPDDADAVLLAYYMYPEMLESH